MRTGQTPSDNAILDHFAGVLLIHFHPLDRLANGRLVADDVQIGPRVAETPFGEKQPADFATGFDVAVFESRSQRVLELAELAIVHEGQPKPLADLHLPSGEQLAVSFSGGQFGREPIQRRRCAVASEFR